MNESNFQRFFWRTLNWLSGETLENTTAFDNKITMNINDATHPPTENDTDDDDDDSTVSTELSLAEFSGQKSSEIVAVRLNYIFSGFIIASACRLVNRLRVIAMQRWQI